MGDQRAGRDYRVIVDPDFGYHRLDPLPRPQDFEEFYREQYYEAVPEGARAPELQRLLAGGSEGEAEHQWLTRTLWDDIATGLRSHVTARSRRLLDVGCGPGHFTRFIAGQGWDAVGTEPSPAAADVARAQGVRVYDTIEQSVGAGGPFDAATLLNVAEHVFDPVGLIRSIVPALRDRAILVVRVPNDFSALQECARAALGKSPWWVAPPDHVNYFTFDSLTSLLERLGFAVVERLGDFPMELFLLFGEDYVGHPEVGARCHEKRRRFELSIPGDLRRSMYASLAAQGVGRNCLVFARLERRS